MDRAQIGAWTCYEVVNSAQGVRVLAQNLIGMSSPEPETAWNDDRHWGEQPMWRNPRSIYLWFYFGEWGPTVRRILVGLSWLIAVPVVLMLLLYVLYFSRCSVRWLEDPFEEVRFIECSEPTKLKAFGRETYFTTNLYLRQLAYRLKRLRKSTQGGRLKPPRFDQDCEEILMEIGVLKEQAFARSIPHSYKKAYTEQLYALEFLYQSTVRLRDAMEMKDEHERKRFYRDSILTYKNALRTNRAAGESFLSHTGHHIHAHQGW